MSAFVLTIPAGQEGAAAEQKQQGVDEKEKERVQDEAITFGQPLYGFLYPFLGDIPEIEYLIDCTTWLMVEKSRSKESEDIEFVGTEAVNVSIEPVNPELIKRDGVKERHIFEIPVLYSEMKTQQFVLPFMIAVMDSPEAIFSQLTEDAGIAGKGKLTELNPIDRSRYTVTGEMWVKDPEKAERILIEATEKIRAQLEKVAK